MEARLAKLGIHSTRDLCEHYPMRYEDRSKVYSAGAVPFDTPVSVRGTLISVSQKQTRRRNITLITAGVTDGLDTLSLVWFNHGNYLLARLRKLEDRNVTVYGSVTMDRAGYPVMIGAEILEDPDTDEVIVPVYNLTDGIGQNQMRSFVRKALEYEREFYHETLPLSVREEYGLEGLWEAVRGMHYPDSPEGFLRARDRLAFEELFVLQLALVQRKQRQKLPGRGISFRVPDDFFTEFRSLFPFPLTEGQKRSVMEIVADMRKPDCMNRLLQGDVGSGKTLTALAGMLLCCKNGMQAAIMAPTEILAEQHYLSFRSMLGDKEDVFRPALLTGSLKASERKKTLEDVESGAVQLVIGTHALIADKVRFHRLGLVVVDEQHRFGVRQRTALYDKARDASPLGPRPDLLLMTATPIPRTLTNAVYGDLDISVIDTMPPGRQPVRTHWKKPEERPRVYRALKSLIAQGQQAYVVCPLIEESEAITSRAATELCEELKRDFFPEYPIALLHGQQSADEKERIMTSFRKGDVKILVSTSVIEVGVDVANATCMIIESADRFGLSQLHQLRGRVGRGSQQSYCILISEGVTEDSRKRLEIMTRTNNGFEISEEDLRLRGPGELSGVRQSGLSDFKAADIFRDGALLQKAKELARSIIEADPGLDSPDWQQIKRFVAAKSAEIEATTN